MDKNSPEYLFDARLVKRHIAQGLITQKEYDAHVEKLADRADEGELIPLDAFVTDDVPVAGGHKDLSEIRKG